MQIVKANDVSLNKEALKCQRTEEAIRGMAKFRRADLEAASGYNDPIIGCGYHGLINLAQIAFAEHYPLILTPDAIWLTITQGIAKHIELNAEKLRPQFVSHSDKILIVVERNDFVRRSETINWMDIFTSFSEKIEVHVGKETHSRFIADFSTTGPIERAASEIVLMDSMKQYFDYMLLTRCGIARCGIPYVGIDGTVEDWEKIKERTLSFRETSESCPIKLSWWIDKIVPILDEIIEAAKGNGNEKFFKDIFKDIFNEGGSSGGPYYTGWLTKFIPYTTGYSGEWYPNSNVIKKESYGINAGELPSSLSSVPFVWKYLGTDYNYKFIAGIIGGTQSPEYKAIKPKIGWAIQEVHNEEV